MEYHITNGGDGSVDFKKEGSFSDVKITNKEVGAKATYFSIKMDGKNKKFYVQTPSLLVPKGIDVYDSPDGQQKFYLELSFSTNNIDEDIVKEITNFKSICQEYDEFNVQQGIKNSQAWIGKKASEEIVRDKYHPMLRFSKDEEGNINDMYPPSIRFRIYKGQDGKFTTKCYDSQKNEVELEEAIQKGCRVKVLYHQQSCWLNKNTGYGASNKLLQIKVYPSTKITGYAFIDDDEAEDVGDVEDTLEEEDNVEKEEDNIEEEEDNAEEEEVNDDLDAGLVEPEHVADKPKKGGRKKKVSA